MAEEIVEQLSQLPELNMLSQSIIQDLTEGSSIAAFRSGQIIALEGARAENIGIIVQGIIKVYRTLSKGDEIVIRMMSSGDVIFTEIGGEGERTFQETYKTIRDTRLVWIEKSHFVNCMKSHPELSVALFSISQHQNQKLTNEITLVKWQYLPQRVAKYLLDLSVQKAGRVILSLPYEKSVLASRLGVSPESLSRAFAKLSPVGIEVDNMQVSIKDISRLKDFSETFSHVPRLVSRNGGKS